MFFSRSFVVVVYCQFKVYMSFVSVRITRPSVWQKCNLSFIYSQCDRRNAKCLKFVDWEDIQHCSFRDANFSVKKPHPDWIFAFREKYEYQMSTSALWKAWSAAQNANNIQWMCHVTCVCVCVCTIAQLHYPIIYHFEQTYPYPLLRNASHRTKCLPGTHRVHRTNEIKEPNGESMLLLFCCFFFSSL